MRLVRRRFLGGIAAGTAATLLRPAFAAAPDSPFVLRAAPAEAQLAPDDMAATGVWAYDGTIPGPVLRVAQGARLRVRFENALPQPSTIHWHGIRIENAMDGVAGLTQPAVEPGESFLYDFAVPDAGTYWYHPHYRSWEQQARGLSGALIVEEPAPPLVDRDIPVVLDDWRLREDGSIDAESFGSLRDWSHAGRLGNWITANGEGEPVWPAARHERLRLRLINTATARIFTLAHRGLAGWVIAVDGQPVAPAALPERLVLAPAQRIDLIVDIAAEEGGEALLASVERDTAYALVSMPVASTLRDAALPPPEELRPNPVPRATDLSDALTARIVMEGGAMGGLASAMLDGEELPIRELAEKGRVWAFNGVAGMPEAPLFETARGRTVRIVMVNDTAWPHAMHIHGHHFQRVTDGRAAGPLHDTLLMDPRDEAEIAFVADNPGDWLIHCHMAEHMAAGMVTRFRVV